MENHPALLILRVIALEKDVWLSNLAPKIRGKRRTVLRYLPELEKEGLARVKERNREHRGRPRKKYEITPLGVIALLAKDDYIFEKIDTVAQVHSDLIPLVFGKWAFFEKQGIKSTVLANLSIASRTKMSDEAWRAEVAAFEHAKNTYENRPEDDQEAISKGKELYSALYGPKIGEKVFRKERTVFKETSSPILHLFKDWRDPKHDFLNIVFGFTTPLGYETKTDEKWTNYMTALHKDAEIRAYIEEEFGYLQKQYGKYLSNIKSWRAWWNQL